MYWNLFKTNNCVDLSRLKQALIIPAIHQFARDRNNINTACLDTCWTHGHLHGRVDRFRFFFHTQVWTSKICILLRSKASRGSHETQKWEGLTVSSLFTLKSQLLTVQLSSLPTPRDLRVECISLILLSQYLYLLVTFCVPVQIVSSRWSFEIPTQGMVLLIAHHRVPWFCKSGRLATTLRRYDMLRLCLQLFSNCVPMMHSLTLNTKLGTVFLHFGNSWQDIWKKVNQKQVYSSCSRFQDRIQASKLRPSSFLSEPSLFFTVAPWESIFRYFQNHHGPSQLPRWNSAECWSQAKPANHCNGSMNLRWLMMINECSLLVHLVHCCFIPFCFLMLFGMNHWNNYHNRCLVSHSSLIGRCAKTPKDLEDRILICIIFAWSSELPTTKYASNNHSVSWIKAEVMSIWLSPGNKTSKSWNKNMPSFNCLGILEFFLWAKCVVVPGAWAVAISATIQPNDQISVGVAYLSFDPEHTASGH